MGARSTSLSPVYPSLYPAYPLPQWRTTQSSSLKAQCHCSVYRNDPQSRLASLQSELVPARLVCGCCAGKTICSVNRALECKDRVFPGSNIWVEGHRVVDPNHLARFDGEMEYTHVVVIVTLQVECRPSFRRPDPICFITICHELPLSLTRHTTLLLSFLFCNSVSFLS